MYPQSNTESKTEETVFRLPVNSNSAEIECSQRVSHELNERYDSQFYLDYFFEYEQGSAEPIVRGRMKANIDFWRNIGAPDEIIKVVETGYRIPFIQTPATANFKNNKSARDNPEFVCEAILDLLTKNLVIELDHVPDFVNPLSVSQFV